MTNGTNNTRTIFADVSHILVLLGLVFVLWFILVHTGILQCSALPGSCEVYWGIIRGNTGGKAKVLIVYGDGGDGDHELLEKILASPEILGVRAKALHLELVTLNTLKNYDLVIVEEAKKMSTEKVKMFIDYAIGGGRLIWTGNAATELGEDKEGVKDKMLLYGELYEEDINTSRERIPIGPWARKRWGDAILLNELLGADYNGNYCELFTCVKKDEYHGLLKPEPAIEHKLIYGISPALKFHGDFSIVDPIDDAPTKIVLSLDMGSNKKTRTGIKINRHQPLIITSGIGERVVYYAVPPEQFYNPERNMNYVTLVENMYLGMLR